METIKSFVSSNKGIIKKVGIGLAAIVGLAVVGRALTKEVAPEYEEVEADLVEIEEADQTEELS